MHGGKQPQGIAANGWKHGRYSKWAQAFGSRGEAIAEAAADDELLNLRRTVAVFEVAMREAAHRLDSADTPEWRKRAVELCGLAKDAMSRIPEQLAALATHLEKGAEEDKAYALLLDRTERLHRAVNDTLDTMLRGANVLTKQQLEVFVAGLWRIVQAETTTQVYARIVERCRVEILGNRTDERRLADTAS